MLLCECLSVLAGHCVVWLSDSHSLKVWLFVSNLFATPALGQSSGPINSLSSVHEKCARLGALPFAAPLSFRLTAQIPSV